MRAIDPLPVSPVLVLLPLLLSCAAAPVAGPSVDDKSREFFSESAVEFLLEGRTTVTLEEDYLERSEDEQKRRMRELVNLKHLALSYFLTQFFITKEHDEPGAGWGGAGGMARNGSYEDLNIRRRGDGLTYSFTFRHIIASTPDLLRKLPLNDDGAFTLTIGTPSNEELAKLETDKEWYRTAPWKNFDPSTVPDEQKTDVELSVTLDEGSDDAWLDYERLFEDDRLTIDVHFGWDYHSDYHQKHAVEFCKWLKSNSDGLGYTAPRSPRSADARLGCETELDSALDPFTGELWVPAHAGRDARAVKVEVRLFYGRTGGRTDPSTVPGAQALEDDMRASFRTADIIVYSGHSGPFYGFSMANWRSVTGVGDISYEEIESLEMPADRYQVVVADGCDTYQIGEAFARNPHKAGGRNVDVITTTDFGTADFAYSTMNFILHLLTEDSLGYHRPPTIRSLLRDLREGHYDNPLFGVHFTDDNPKLHPYADMEYIGYECTAHDQCGAAGNRCWRAEEICAAACTSDSGCGRGYRCATIAASNAIYDRGCVPVDYEGAE